MQFDAWKESLILAMIFLVMVGSPCAMIAWLGKKLIDRLGTWPSQAPTIHMSVFGSLIVVEILTLVAFYIFIQLFLL